MAQLYGRQVTLQLAGVTYICGGDNGLRCSFNVTKTRDKSLNKASIQLYNPDTREVLRDVITQPKLPVRLAAGYDVPRIIFAGFAIKHGVMIDRQAPDRILKVLAQSNGGVSSNANVSLSFQGSVSYEQVINAALDGLGLPRGIIKIPTGSAFLQGFSYTGNAYELLTRLTDTLGADFTIHDGTLEVLPRTSTRLPTGPLYSTELGNIIEAPKPHRAGDKVVQGAIQVTVLMDPSILPGDRFVVQDSSSTFNGTYKASAVIHKGDSGFSSQFYTTITGAPYG